MQKQSFESIVGALESDGYKNASPDSFDVSPTFVSLIVIHVFYKSSTPLDAATLNTICNIREQLQIAAHNTQQYLTRSHLFTDSLWDQLLQLIRLPSPAASRAFAASLHTPAFTPILAPQRDVANAIRDVLCAAFNINCVVLEHHRERNQWHEAAKRSLQAIGPHSYETLSTTLDELHSTIQDQEKRFIYRHEEGKHILYAPFAVRGTPMTLRFAFLAFDKVSLPHLLPEALFTLISRFIREELREARIRVLTYISQLALRHATSLPYRHIVTEFDWRRTLADFCDLTFRMLLPVTNAFAMTLRMYEQSSATLVLYVDQTSLQDAPYNQYPRKSEIPLADEHSSLNARTFKHCAKHHYRTRPHQDHRQALNPYGAKSEICFPLHFKSRPVGTINIEYAMSDGYSVETDYLAAVVATVESYLEMLLDSNDKYWLMTQIQYEQNVHEVENAIDGLPRVSKKRRDAIRRLLSRRLGVDAVNHAPLSDLRQSFSSELNLRLRPAGSGLPSTEIQNIYQLITFREFPEEVATAMVPEYWSGLTAIVISNLISNYFKHCDWEESATLLFSMRGQHFVARRGSFVSDNALTNAGSAIVDASGYAFVAECHGNTPFDETTLRSGTVRPVYRGSSSQEQPRNMSRGLLICGIIARHLGGFIHIGNREERGSLRPVVQVVIPAPLFYLSGKA